MSEITTERDEVPAIRRRNRKRVTGTDVALLQVEVRQTEVVLADRALLKARAKRAEAVRQALKDGWSVRGLAEALGVDPKWVQRAQRSE